MGTKCRQAPTSMPLHRLVRTLPWLTKTNRTPSNKQESKHTSSRTDQPFVITLTKPERMFLFPTQPMLRLLKWLHHLSLRLFHRPESLAKPKELQLEHLARSLTNTANMDRKTSEFPVMMLTKSIIETRGRPLEEYDQ